MAFIAGAIFGCFIGAALMYAYKLKEVKDMRARMDALEESFENTIKQYMEVVYMKLVQLRDSGTDNLDELIGSLGRILGHNEEDESETQEVIRDAQEMQAKP